MMKQLRRERAGALWGLHSFYFCCSAFSLREGQATPGPAASSRRRLPECFPRYCPASRSDSRPMRPSARDRFCRETLVLRPFVPSSLNPFVPFVPPPLCPFVPSSLRPFVPLFLCPFVPSSLCPSAPLSLCPFVPLYPFVPLSLCPSVPLSLVPLSLCPSVPLSLRPSDPFPVPFDSADRFRHHGR